MAFLLYLGARSPHDGLMESKEAEQAAQNLLEHFGFQVTQLATRSHEKKKTTDFRAQHQQESWVLDVKERLLDLNAEERLDAGERVEQTARPEDDPSQPYMALKRFKKGAKQIKDTRQAGELGAVWFVMSEHVTKAIDHEQLFCALLGMRRIAAPFPHLQPVFGVYEPEFGTDADAVVLQKRNQIMVLLNPWAAPERLARARASHLIKCAGTRAFDPAAELAAGRAWEAPSPEEARRLGALALQDLDTDRSIDDHEGRKRRLAQVENALRYIHGDHVGSFFYEVLHVVRERIPDDK